MNDRDFIVSIRDQCNAQLDGASAPPSGQVAAITVKPSPTGDLGSGNDAPSEKQVTAGQVLGYTFTTRAGAIAREIKWAGKPGAFWDRCSWAVFDSGGSRVMGEDNILPAGTLGYAISSQLMALGAGSYTFAVAVDAAGNLATQFNQRP